MKSQHTRREKRQIVTTRAHPVAWLLRRAAARFGCIETSANEWLLALNRNARDDAKASKDWPTTPNQLGRLFGELRGGLELLGVEVTFRRSNGARLWRVESLENRQKREAEAANRRHFESTPRQWRDDERAQWRAEKDLLRSVEADWRRQNRKTR